MLSKILDWLSGAALPLIVCIFAYLAGYTRGDFVTSCVYEARVASINTAHAERETVWAKQEQARAEAVAAAEKSARERLAAETARGNALADEVLQKTKQLDAERASINKRIKNASENARRDCTGLSHEWVRVYNDALGLASADHRANSTGSAPGGAGNAAGATRTAGTGVQLDALATPEDVLAHARDYGGYCRKLEAGYKALIVHAKDTP